VLLGIFWGFIGDLLGIYWGFIGVFLGIYWGFCGTYLLEWGGKVSLDPLKAQYMRI